MGVFLNEHHCVLQGIMRYVSENLKMCSSTFNNMEIENVMLGSNKCVGCHT